MALILLLETATKNCSVALADGPRVLGVSERSEDKYIHAEMLHVFISELMKDCARSLSELEAVAVSKGPGSYTGLRIGVSTAKGLAYALDIPLISVSSLDGLAHHGHAHFPGFSFYRPMLDARRDEVYTSLFDRQLTLHEPIVARIVDAEIKKIGDKTLYIGDGASKVLAFGVDAACVIQVLPSASMLAVPAAQRWRDRQFEDTAYFEPFYLKDFIPGISSKPLL